MKKLAASLLAVMSLAFAGAVHATPLKWTLSGVTLSDTTALTGSFFYDADTNAYSGWSLATSGGALPAFTYNTGGSSLIGLSGAAGLFVIKNGYERYLNLNFVAPLTAAGGMVALELATTFTDFYTGSWECNNCSTFRWVTGGSVIAGDVPEPSSVALLGLALAGVGVSRRKRS